MIDAGGLSAPKKTSYDVAFVALHVNVTLVPRPVAPFVGLGLVAGPGGVPPAVVNDQTGPGVPPPLFRATICQKYVVLVASGAAGVNQGEVTPVATCGGGLLVPIARS